MVTILKNLFIMLYRFSIACKEWSWFINNHKSHGQFCHFVKKIADLDKFPALFDDINVANIIFVTPSRMESLQNNSNYKVENASENLVKISPNLEHSKMAACTWINEKFQLAIYICPEHLVDEVYRVNKGNHWYNGYSAASVILHEFWHYRQLTYLMEKGGVEMVSQVLAAESNYKYGDSPLERGAINYGNSLGVNKQNLKEVEPVISYSKTMGLINKVMCPQ